MINKKNVKIITDMHLYHFNAYYYYDQRCKEGEGEKYLESQINNLRKSLSPNDILISLGDVILQQASKLTEILNSVHCKLKFNCIGNHDKSPSWLMNHGFDYVGQILKLEINEQTYIFCHYPLKDHNYNLLTKKYPNCYIICGHIHYNKITKLKPQMITLPPDVIYDLNEIDKQFSSLRRKNNIRTKTNGYVSASEFKKITKTPNVLEEKVRELNKNKQKKTSKMYVSKNGNYDLTKEENILDITPLV